MSATPIEETEPRAPSTSETSAPSAIKRMALKAATVNEDIIARKKFIAPVMVPTWERVTEFCSATTLTGKAVPSPMPNTESSTSKPHKGGEVRVIATPAKV